MRTEIRTTIFLEKEEKQIIDDFYHLIQDICDESDLVECKGRNCPLQDFCHYTIGCIDGMEDMADHITEMFEEINVNVSK